MQIPPDGVIAKLPFEVPQPGSFPTIGGVRVHFTFGQAIPSAFSPRLLIDGENYSLSQSAGGPTSRTFIMQFPEALDAPQQAEVWLNDGITIQPGSVITAYAWGAQTESGQGALNPDEGGVPSTLTDTIELGTVEVITWPEWNRLTGANQGEEDGS